MPPNEEEVPNRRSPSGRLRKWLGQRLWQRLAGHWLGGAWPARHLDRRIDQRREELEDLRWQFRAEEQRFRDLLDAQAELIVRRDPQGHITFANTSFCRLFGVALPDVMGRPFTPIVLATAHRPVPVDAPGPAPASTAATLVQQVATAEGPRWIAWEERTVPGARGESHDRQTVGRDVTEERRFEAALARARDDAEAANRAKSRFLASMSHEIRTPMNGIMGMTALLTETQLSGDQRTYVEAIDRSARTLLALIDEILDFSKIEAGRLQLEAAEFDIVDAVQSVVELLAPRGQEKGLEIGWSCCPDLPRRMIGDGGRVRQILLNLLGNAIKFTERGGVLVSVCVAPGETTDGRITLKLAIRDTGPGLSSEAQSRIFREFEQPVLSRTHPGGTGLGLAISRRIARAMDGDIAVESAVARGALFTVTLRLEAAPGAVAVVPPAERPRSGARALIAISRLIERRAMAAALMPLGVQVEERADPTPEELIAFADRGAVDLLVLDGGEIHGDVAAALADLAAAGRPPARRTIALIEAKDRESTLRQGIDGVLIRPVRPATLLAHLQRALSHGDAGAFPAIAATPHLGQHGQHGPADPNRPATPEAPAGVQFRVLLAEDNEINALLATTMLAKVGCAVLHVTDGRAAVEAIERGERFDLALMDVHMPVLDGLAATAAIRSLERRRGWPRLAIVALTAHAFREDRERCLAAGMDDYIAKPFERSAIAAVLERFCPRGAEVARASGSGDRAA